MKQAKSIVRCQRGKGRFRRRVVVGGDFNISLLRDIEGVTCAAVELRRPHRGKAADEWATKHELWAQLCLENDMEAWTTFDFTKEPHLDKEGETTTRTRDTTMRQIRGHHTWWGHGDVRSQIDCILGDRDACKSWGIGQPAFRSGHAVMWAMIDAGAPKP